jgi:hypothetical protein
MNKSKRQRQDSWMISLEDEITQELNLYSHESDHLPLVPELKQEEHQRMFPFTPSSPLPAVRDMNSPSFRAAKRRRKIENNVSDLSESLLVPEIELKNTSLSTYVNTRDPLSNRLEYLLQQGSKFRKPFQVTSKWRTRRPCYFLFVILKYLLVSFAIVEEITETFTYFSEMKFLAMNYVDRYFILKSVRTENRARQVALVCAFLAVKFCEDEFEISLYDALQSHHISVKTFEVYSFGLISQDA